ncbi:Coenzyme F420 hydrogenase/dehydrogenase, beta subunit C-terminal domain [Hoeflea poritis]|uniref:Coenzyme F420 hydrogenase/dehydrogenase, beta subunit C-terminal domain n=1 Tax=Hoeflea poritis TaxID=2993659 RepID=A0ABT4VJL8_9HYPH|nr:Coenzyme F420 hydrogenase/dehydrogenase, beta subunit C-terminal domain [Hoeflea poritis]MDA4844908.1 Coenzyme F420 hydrogenase/dehydrogenase, beta subunit C-terminal domain [Hoeflea poritis]
MTPEDRFYRIVESGLCIGCGLCQSVAGKGAVRMDKAENGELRPHVHGTLTDDAVDAVYRTCPGTRAEGLPESVAKQAPHSDTVWGPYHAMALAWAAEPQTRHEGSAGGVLTALGRYLLSSDRVSFILHVKASATEPSFGERTLSFSEAQVLEGAGSRYGPTAPLVDFEDALAHGEPFALIAKPCDLNAVRNLAHHDPRVNALVRYWLSPVCGGYMPTEAMHRFMGEHGIERSNVAALRYRGFGCPGPTTFSMQSGEERSFHYLDFWGEDESAWSLPFRCKICPDGIGDGADIAAADIWPNATPDRLGSQTDPGFNSIIVRTAAGIELVDAAVDAGFLAMGEQVGPDFMNDTQPHQKKKKLAAGTRLEAIAQSGRPRLETVGLRLEELAALNGDKNNRLEREGTARRLREGQGMEQRPGGG